MIWAVKKFAKQLAFMFVMQLLGLGVIMFVQWDFSAEAINFEAWEMSARFFWVMYIGMLAIFTVTID